MTADEQEALSRKYSNDVIMLLPLQSGRVAVFNSARNLCGIALPTLLDVKAIWRSPQVHVSLEDIGL